MAALSASITNQYSWSDPHKRRRHDPTKVSRDLEGGTADPICAHHRRAQYLVLQRRTLCILLLDFPAVTTVGHWAMNDLRFSLATTEIRLLALSALWGPGADLYHPFCKAKVSSLGLFIFGFVVCGKRGPMDEQCRRNGASDTQLISTSPAIQRCPSSIRRPIPFHPCDY